MIELVIVALIVGIVLFNLIVYLIDFQKEINDKVEIGNDGKKNVSVYNKVVNWVLGGLILVIMLIWGVTNIKLPEKV